MTTYSWVGRFVPAALCPATTGEPAEDWTGGPHDPAASGDLLGWLGFTPGHAGDEPLVTWPRPTVRPVLRRRHRGRHRALRPHAV